MIKFRGVNNYCEETDTYIVESSKKIIMRDLLQYPNNSIIHKDIYTKLLNNIDKIPILELDEFLNKYNCL